MHRIDYYRERSGRIPVAEWLDDLYRSDKNISAHLTDKIVRLQQHGLLLLNTKMMRTIKGDSDFYELKYSNYRIAFYYDRAQNLFILLHGFKKERGRESNEVKTAHARLREYQSRRRAL